MASAPIDNDTPLNHRPLISAAARTLVEVAPQLPLAEELLDFEDEVGAAAARGHFDAVEDERVLATFGRYLRVRAALGDIVDDLAPVLWDFNQVSGRDRLSAFLVAYTASCMLMRSAEALIDSYAEIPLVHEKLDQGDPRFAIPRKQFTAVYKSRTDPLNYLRFDLARTFAKLNLSKLAELGAEPEFAGAYALFENEHGLAAGFSKAKSFKGGLRYRLHSWARRRRSSLKQVSFALFEMGGRSVSSIHNPLQRKAVTPAVCTEIEALLRPGDALVTRHADAATNLFLPGFWPHSALYVGSESERSNLGVDLASSGRRLRAADPARTLEALKDGVRFRPLGTTLLVDCFAVIRPQLNPGEISEGLARAAEHEGKGYDFEFDFARSDRIVCTEVIYRGFHGIGGLDFDLTHRAGRPTFTAEDLLDMALEDRGYEVVALFGVGGSTLVTGELAKERLAASYRA